MAETFSLHHRDLRRIVLAGLIVFALVAGSVLGLLSWAATQIDRLEMEREQALIHRRLDRALEGMVSDLNSATIWDQAVENTAKPDMEWLQANFGDYYADYMHHDATLVYDGQDRLLLASRASEPVTAEAERPLLTAVAPLVRQVRAESETRAKRRASGFEAVVNRSQLLRVGADTYLVAVSTVVTEGAGMRRPAHDAMVVSVKAMPAFLKSLSEDLSIRNPTFSATGVKREAVLPVGGAPGRPLGVISWESDHPGRRLLAASVPVMALVMLMLIAASIFLFIRVDDIARRLVQQQMALSEARDRAEAANEAKSRFLANMSHELRTPLNGVLGMAEVMDAGDLSPVQRNHLSILKASGGSLLRLIEHLLQITRLEKNEIEIVTAPFDMAHMIEEAIEDHRERADEKTLTLRSRISIHGPRLGDEARLKEVLGYLLDNALTYTERGGVTVEADGAGETVEIRVVDTGVGIAPDLLPRLFDKFVQADDSATRRFDGAGLGLSICRNLVLAMGGSIRVSSTDRGSTFVVTLALPPVKVARPEPAPAALLRAG